MEDWTIDTEQELHEMLAALEEDDENISENYSAKVLHDMLSELVEHLAWRCQLRPLRKHRCACSCVYCVRVEREHALLRMYGYEPTVVQLG